MPRRFDPSQLDFLTTLDSPPEPERPADLVIFPASNMKGELREAARFVLALPINRQAAHKRRCADVFRKLFQRRRLSRAQIDRAVAEFSRALDDEIRRQLILEILLEQRGGAA